MKASILMSTVAVAALASPAFAGPDRFVDGCDMNSTACTQQQLTNLGGKPGQSPDGAASVRSGLNGSAAANASNSGDNNDLSDEAGHLANETGDEISNTADEAGDAIGEAANDVGDAIDDAF